MHESGAVRADRTGPARAAGALAFRLVRVGESFAPLLELFEIAHRENGFGWSYDSAGSARRAWLTRQERALEGSMCSVGIGRLAPTLRSLEHAGFWSFGNAYVARVGQNQCQGF